MKPLPAILFGVIFALSQTVYSQEDLSKLEQSAVSLIEAFNEGDAEGVASLFVPQGELVLSSGELVIGTENLLSHYTTVFADPGRPQAALEAGSVRFLTGDVAMEDGTVHLTYPDGEISSHFYQAVHAKQEDGSWRFASIRDVAGDHALPSEKLLALEWLIGDWAIQTEGAHTWITFLWSPDGPYIDAKALTDSTGVPATAATMRIGWNEKEEAFHSWAFDAEGGFNQSIWFEAGESRWILKTKGVTADGETNTVTQVLSPNGSGQGFSWTKRDQVIGGAVLEDRIIQSVKRPPAPAEAE
jgi:uncharacterized protein (TIGR02246 family)